MLHYRMTNNNNWLFRSNPNNKTPSILKGLSEKDEQIKRRKGTSFILQVAHTLRM